MTPDAYDSMYGCGRRWWVRVREDGRWILRQATEQEVDLLFGAYQQASSELTNLVEKGHDGR